MTVVQEASKERVVAPRGSTREQERASSPAAWPVLAAGAIMLLGVVVDLGVLWFLQHEGTPQWEFAALSTSMDSVPRFAFGLGFLFLGLHLRNSTSKLSYRVLGSLLLALGLVALAAAALMAMSYLSLGNLVTEPSVYTMLRSVAIKTIGLAVIYSGLSIPAGIAVLRRPTR